MKAADMHPGVRYVVTRRSRCGDFVCGDRIATCPDGAVINYTVGGWMDAADVAAGTDGMECDIDAEWAAKRREKLAGELAALGTA